MEHVKLICFDVLVLDTSSNQIKRRGFLKYSTLAPKRWSAMMPASLFTCRTALFVNDYCVRRMTWALIADVETERASVTDVWFRLNKIWPWISDNSEIHRNNKRRTGCTLKHSMTHPGPLMVTLTLIRLDRLVMSTVLENLMGNVQDTVGFKRKKPSVLFSLIWCKTGQYKTLNDSFIDSNTEANLV